MLVGGGKSIIAFSTDKEDKEIIKHDDINNFDTVYIVNERINEPIINTVFGIVDGQNRTVIDGNNYIYSELNDSNIDSPLLNDITDVIMEKNDDDLSNVSWTKTYNYTSPIKPFLSGGISMTYHHIDKNEGDDRYIKNIYLIGDLHVRKPDCVKDTKLNKKYTEITDFFDNIFNGTDKLIDFFFEFPFGLRENIVEYGNSYISETREKIRRLFYEKPG